MEVVGAANIDVLFVNAGISRFKPISMIDEAFFDTLFGINVGDAYFVMKHAIEIMPDGGLIILTSSISGACCRTDRVWSYESGSSLVRTNVRPGACASTQSVPARSRHLVSPRPECSSDKWRT